MADSRPRVLEGDSSDFFLPLVGGGGGNCSVVAESGSAADRRQTIVGGSGGELFRRAHGEFRYLRADCTGGAEDPRKSHSNKG